MPTITVTGKPLGQPRQRHSVVNGMARNYLQAAHPIHGFKYAIATAWTFGVLEGPLCCRIEAVFPRPKSKTKKCGDNPRYPHQGKPDADNIAKAVCDALNGIAYKDDSAITLLVVLKWVAAAKEVPHVTITMDGVMA